MIELALTAGLLIIGFVVGSSREKAHFDDLLRRERLLLTRLPYRVDPGPPIASGEAFLLASSVVVASDYFKNFIVGIKNFFGGRLSSHESLLDRARREALCRVREKALAQGASEIVNVRIETAFLDQLGIEVSAYGTAIRR